MIIKELKLGHFGKFHNTELSLKPGINVIYGENEAGKSTLHTFIRGMLFGIEKGRGRAGREDVYTKYEPWETPGAYQGSMKISIDGEEYLITRSFYKKEKRLQVVSVKTGRQVCSSEHEVTELLKGLDESVYKNTVSIAQLKARTEYELAEELKNYITNLSMTKSTEVDVNHALSYLNDKRKQLEKSIPEEEILTLKKSIMDEQNIMDEMEQLNNELEELTKQAEEIQRNMQKYTDNSSKDKLSKLTLLPAIKEKYVSYKEMKTQMNQIEDRLSALKERTKKQPSDLDQSSVIQSHLEELEQLRQKKQEYETESRQKRAEWESSQKKGKLNGKILGSIGVITGLVLCILPFGNNIIRGCIGILLMLLGVMQYGYKATKDQRSQQQIEEVEKQFERSILKLHSKRHDILLSHRVANEGQLLSKFNEVTKNELEQEQAIERKAEFLSTLSSLEQKTEALELEIINFMSYFISDPMATDDCMEELKFVTEEFKEETIQGEKAYQQQYEEVKSKMERIRWTIETNHDQEVKLMKDKDSLKELLSHKEELLVELQAIQLSIETLRELSSSIHDTFGSKLNEAVSEHINRITDGEYKEVTVDEHLNIKVLHQTHYVGIEQLSAGTIDQMYLSLRLAVAELLFPDVKLPIILDDAFAMYDDERAKKALCMLADESNRQIILLTCHHREEQILEQEQCSFNYITL